MQITMKLADALNLNNAVKEIIDHDTSRIDALFKFKLLGIMKNLESYVTNFNVIRNEKIKEYGKEDENGTVTISQEDNDAIQKFTEDINQLINSDITVDIQKLKAKDVFDSGVPSEYLVGLYPIMEE
ncbi:MAG: hypothetical protein J5979_04130 [Lachnospiraceae bacterium]|nr:hypothetical protein [Lachnospiraceae bacterium]